jgi:hypothetical protein
MTKLLCTMPWHGMHRQHALAAGIVQLVLFKLAHNHPQLLVVHCLMPHRPDMRALARRTSDIARQHPCKMLPAWSNHQLY